MKAAKNKETRPPIKEKDKIAVWAAAAGRCTFCNSYLIENEMLGEAVSIGELAHNVGWSQNSPRGKDTMSASDAILLTTSSWHARTVTKS